MQMIKAAAAAAVLAASAAPAIAQDAPRGPVIEGTVLSVSAEGMAEGRPDMALVNLGVTTEGQTAQAALAANAQRATALTQALRRAGTAERDIQTQNVSVNPQYAYAEGAAPRLTGYQASNTVIARVRNVANTGRVIDAAVAAGGNTVNGVSFTFQNPSAQLDAARRDAAQAARARADLYANAFGMRVHRVIAISESGAMAPPMPMPMYARMAAQDAVANTPVSPGEIETRLTLNVTYELR